MKPVMNKPAEPDIERRKHRRYIVRGRVRFTIDSLEVLAELVNFGEGGVLIQSMFDLPVGTHMDLRILTFCYPIAVDGVGQVVGGCGDLLAIQFVEKPPEADRLLRWLEVEHYPWTGTFDDPDVGRLNDAERRQSAPVGTLYEKQETARIEKMEEEIFQRA